MDDKKRVIILVTIALILAATAITLSIMDSDEIQTARPSAQDQPSGGIVGVEIQPTSVEDKLMESQPPQ